MKLEKSIYDACTIFAENKKITLLLTFNSLPTTALYCNLPPLLSLPPALFRRKYRTYCSGTGNHPPTLSLQPALYRRNYSPYCSDHRCPSPPPIYYLFCTNENIVRTAATTGTRFLLINAIPRPMYSSDGCTVLDTPSPPVYMPAPRSSLLAHSCQRLLR